MTIAISKPAPVQVIDVTADINRRFAERETWLNEFQAGQFAFRRGEFPRKDWPAGRLAGWNFQGELANLAATVAPPEQQEHWADRETTEYLPLSEEPGYSESLEPWKW